MSRWRSLAMAMSVSAATFLVVACSSSQTQVTTKGSTESTGTSGADDTTGATPSEVTESPSPEALPSPLTGNVSHGERYFGVYLAAAPFDAPGLGAAVEQLATFGVDAFPGSIACDEGAAEQLGVPNDVAVVAIYFERRPDAVRWLTALDPPPLGLAMVRTFCAD